MGFEMQVVEAFNKFANKWNMEVFNLYWFTPPLLDMRDIFCNIFWYNDGINVIPLN